MRAELYILIINHIKEADRAVLPLTEGGNITLEGGRVSA
jgi:hypothetical protein